MTTDNKQDNISVSPFDSRIVFKLIRSTSEETKSLYSLENEEALIASASSPKRKQEFRLGRIAAKRALEALGLNLNTPVLRGEAGEPLWPTGIKGSIAHSNGIAVAAVTSAATIAGLGIDLESLSRPRELKIFDRILTNEERHYVHDSLDSNKEKFIKAIKIFSAKEACFKAFFEATGTKLTFKDASFCPGVTEETLHGTLLVDTKSPMFKSGYSFSCTFRIFDEYLVAGVLLDYPNGG